MRLNGVKWPTLEPLLWSAGSLEYGLSFMSLPPVLLTGPTRPGHRPILGAYKSKLFTRSAWKVSYANFGFTEFSEGRRQNRAWNQSHADNTSCKYLWSLLG
jgi:hypothetical protein